MTIDGTPMTGGYISIQAETAPTDFRKIEVLNLEGCMDPKSASYKKYFVKAKPCDVPVVSTPRGRDRAAMPGHGISRCPFAPAIHGSLRR